ncbi:MAG: type III-B CRISPR-associated protein Cas10/Cmr2 [Nitrospirae bacterium]|nr:MAG: type III-B CRISPR-associated protein Cas10/Cmr2 [Nitrospirota bacterium]
MTAYLLAIAVGPVQEFIAAARRTRDLWFGSYVLSEISKAVAKAVKDQGAELIFPAPHTDADLAPGSSLNVANIILAELQTQAPQAVVDAARQASQQCWLRFTEQARREAAAVIDQNIWNDQVDDVIEFYAAWVPHADPQRYQHDRARLMRLLDGRKTCRNFLPTKGRAGVPKSSLDGQRESVLKQEDRSAWPTALRLSSGEQLDVVGLTKRLGTMEAGNDPRYPSVSRVAAEAWLQGLHRQGKLEPLKAACERLVKKGLRKVREASYQYFPYEGTIVYQHRHPDLREELGLAPSDLNEVVSALKKIDTEPDPYLAVLVADGDHMGKAIAQLGSADAHQAFSRALAMFAGEAKAIVERHRGVLVYAGGDDVLAFLPVDQSLDCARALHNTFSERLTNYGMLTFSVGIAIGHFLETLEDLLDYGRAAEQHAKNPQPADGPHQRSRNGLAMHVWKRSGSPIMIRANWSDNPDAHLQDLARWISVQAISGRVAYDLRCIASVYDGWPEEHVREAIQRDTIAIMKRKRPRGDSRMDEIEQLVHDRVHDASSLRRISDELLVASRIAAVMRQSGGEHRSEEVAG